MKDKLDDLKLYCKLGALFIAWLILLNNSTLFAGCLVLFLLYDYLNCGPISILYEIEWRYMKWKTHELEHDWNEWIMIDDGMRQIRFCKKCGKIEIR